ncbi:MAG: hypothetical protein PHP01_04055 [Phycisphaerae bacterium]|nr:hypothetical protein [Phycisphaerae bacterium]
MKKEKNISQSGTQPLPLVSFAGKLFYTVDLKNKRFIPLIAETLSFGVPFESEEGKVMCSSAGVVTCKSCGMSVIVSMACCHDQPLRCMRCFNLLKSSDSQ